MNSPAATRSCGFSLIELVTTVAIIGILAALLLPVLQSAKARATRVQCGNNLRQVGIAHHAWAHEHEDKFPAEVPRRNGGTLEIARTGTALQVFQHFQAISNELATPSLLVCPADRRRTRAMTFPELRNTNISYLLNLHAVFGRSDIILSADRNLRTSGRMEGGSIRFASEHLVEWSSDLHAYRGNILFADAHVEDSAKLRAEQFASAGQAVILLSPETSFSLPADTPVPMAQTMATTHSSGGSSNARPAEPNARHQSSIGSRNNRRGIADADGEMPVTTGSGENSALGVNAVAITAPRPANGDEKEAEATEDGAHLPWLPFLQGGVVVALGSILLLFLLLLALLARRALRRKSRSSIEESLPDASE